MPKKLLFILNEVIQNYTKYVGTIITATNTIEKPIKSAILKGSTKYRDIDTGDILDKFDETKNLELVSVKMPVLTTTGKNLFNGGIVQGTVSTDNGVTITTDSAIRSDDYIELIGGETYTISKTKGTKTIAIVIYDENKKFVRPVWNKTFTLNTNEKYIKFADSENDLTNLYQIEKGVNSSSYEPYKSNILTVNEDVTLRSNGDICDELNLLTGQLTQRIDEDGEVLSQEVVKTVDLNILNQNENKVISISSFDDTTHITASSETIPPIFEGYLATNDVE